jgi:hypothetical protein
METFTKAVGVAVIAVVVVFALSILLAFPVKWLWNSILPELFGLKEIGVWMAWKIAFLTSILFKGFSVSSK